MKDKTIAWITLPLMIWLFCAIPLSIALKGNYFVFIPGYIGLFIFYGHEANKWIKNHVRKG